MAEWIIDHAGALPGITRMRVRFQAFSFAPHRHDTYAVGITTHGVQAFDYRGVSRESGYGFAFILHPDERHDGRAGTDAGFGYSIAHVSPGLIRDALGGGALPFVRDPVSSDARLIAAIRELLTMAEPDPEIGSVSALSALAFAMQESAGVQRAKSPRLDHTALRNAEAILREARDRRVSMTELEQQVGLSRWELARQFRAYFGVSLARFNLLRRLDHVQHMLQTGHSAADTAAACGFVDQSHMMRSFKRTYGLTPGQWLNFKNSTRKED